MRKDVLTLDAETEIERIAQSLRAQVLGDFRRRGAVLGLSGGIDSSVVAALCVRAFGKDKVLGLFMPERHSSDDALMLGRLLADTLGIEAIVEDIAPALEGLGCYRRQDEAIRSIVPQYGAGWKCKLVLPSILEASRLNVTRLTVQSPQGEISTVRLTPTAYLQIVAATNYKQRVRKMTEYYHADRVNYAVAGTPNRLEYDQGFFVKGGDGLADVKPIAHLYKSQVYAMARHLGLPDPIASRQPTTETFSIPQTQEEFYFGHPYDRMDLLVWGEKHDVPAAQLAPLTDIDADGVEAAYTQIQRVRDATAYLHAPAITISAEAD